MSYINRMYIGPFWSCTTHEVIHNKMMSSCTTVKCQNHIDLAIPYSGSGNWHLDEAKFCPLCATPISKVPVPLKYQAPNCGDLEVELEKHQFRFQDRHLSEIWFPWKKPKVNFTSHCSELDIYVVEFNQTNISEQIALFEKDCKKEYAILAKAYGEDKIKTGYGLVQFEEVENY